MLQFLYLSMFIVSSGKKMKINIKIVVYNFNMITAKTLQLLDANNINISPAVCVESLYYEKNEEGETYRMSLRNKMIIAGNIGDNDNSMTGDALTVPSYSIKKVSSGDLVVYELNSGSVDISQEVTQYINNTTSLANYYLKEDSDDKYIHNQMGHIQTSGNAGSNTFYVEGVSDTDGSVLIYAQTGGQRRIEVTGITQLSFDDKSFVIEKSYSAEDNFDMTMKDINLLDISTN